MNNYALIAVLILFTFQSYAQLSSVRVTDENGNGIARATLKVFNSPMVLQSNQEGQVDLTSIPPGARLLINAQGFSNLEIFTTDTLSNIILERATIYLEQGVVVTATRFEESAENISSAVTLLQRKELERVNPRSTPEALMGAAGVWVQKTNHGGGSPIIRGLVGNQVLLMVDGIRMNNATYRYGPNQYLATIDPGMVERIEAIRGSGSVMYGSDALGGVVHIFSKSPNFRPDGFGLSGAAYGKWMSAGMEKSGRIELEAASERVAVHGGLSVRSFGDIVAGGSIGTLDPTGYDEIATDAKVHLRTGNHGVLTTAFQHHQQDHVPRYDQITQGGFQLWEFNPQVRQLGYIRWERFIGNPWINSIRITGSLNRSLEEIQSRRNNSTDLRRQRDEINTTGAVAEVYSAFTPNWKAQSGVEWYYDHVNSTSNVLNESNGNVTSQRGSFADGATSANLAVFTSHSYDWNAWNITAGARFNGVTLRVDEATFGRQKISPEAVVGNFGVAYQFQQLRFFVQGNTGFRAPNIDDVSRFGPVESTVFEVPSLGLAPEKSATVETGVKLNSRRVVASLTAYYTRLTDLIDRVPVIYEGQDSIENRRVYQKQNVSKSELRGIEAEAEWKIADRWSLYGNITYTYGENISRNEPMRRIPPLFGRLSLHYQPLPSLWARLDYVAAGEQSRLAAGDRSDARISVRLHDDVMPRWNVFNLYAGYTYDFFTITVSAQNIFDEAYRVYASGVDAYGRSLFISATVRF